MQRKHLKKIHEVVHQTQKTQTCCSLTSIAMAVGVEQQKVIDLHHALFGHDVTVGVYTHEIKHILCHYGIITHDIPTSSTTFILNDGVYIFGVASKSKISALHSVLVVCEIIDDEYVVKVFDPCEGLCDFYEDFGSLITYDCMKLEGLPI